jgi:hypothetical protein
MIQSKPRVRRHFNNEFDSIFNPGASTGRHARQTIMAQPAQGKSTVAKGNYDSQDYATKLALSGLFLSLVMAFGWRMPATKKKDKALKLKATDLALLGVATHRLGRLVAYDKIAEPFRLPFAETVPDSLGAGKTTTARGEGIRRALGELITCPICAGTWIAAGLVYGLHLLPNPTRLLITIMGVTGIAEMLNALVEALSWFGLVERKEFGTRQKKE